MKLLFDENLSPKLVALLANEFRGSSHIELLRMRGTTDRTIWHYAKDHGFIIVSKDNDFRQQVFLRGPPPKVVWLSVGNAGTQAVALLLKQNFQRVEAFAEHPDEGLLVLELERNV